MAKQVERCPPLDAAVSELCGRLIHKLSGRPRDTKQQLNFWRDLSWHLTIGRARDWLALHNLSPETKGGIAAFVEKRPVHNQKVRRGPPTG